jgi:hypothetical protein
VLIGVRIQIENFNIDAKKKIYIKVKISNIVEGYL